MHLKAGALFRSTIPPPFNSQTLLNNPPKNNAMAALAWNTTRAQLRGRGEGADFDGAGTGRGGGDTAEGWVIASELCVCGVTRDAGYINIKLATAHPTRVYVLMFSLFATQTRKTGFLKLALQYGCDVVPVFAFGEVCVCVCMCICACILYRSVTFLGTSTQFLHTILHPNPPKPTNKKTKVGPVLHA